ncbi:COX15/CtaA family protein [Aeromonas hydrophila]|uniref:COX15/CtaA family protein n=1 Tax=Aeromonas hydrophila TaxID=644 RepID=UPI00209CC528|nr:COX15/CtaA family protein [Aeromonas hydrophila]MCP1267808.1 COX15/CtaA family protein [Aeromonas hydrophila]MCP1295745.1 COX15/CtaA family protein [Aeromonas hydrophila]
MKIHKWLASVAIALAVLVILLGAYTRLTDAGLACPDWPGCYGSLAIPQQAHAEQATLLYPDSPLEPHKARSEMVHRYFAGALGCLITTLFVLSWRAGGRLRFLSGALLVLVIGQAALGMWTVTLALHPLVVTTHLLGGFAILTLLWLYRSELGQARQAIVCGQGLTWLGTLACGMLLIQIALGGWTSSNYAAMACAELPVCQAGWQDQLAWEEAFHLPLGHASYEFGVMGKEARQTIHIAHRLGALAAALLVGGFALGLIRHSGPMRAFGSLLLTLLLVQIALGLANVHLALPLANALAHNLVGAHLLVLCVLARRRISHSATSPLSSPLAIRSRI